ASAHSMRGDLHLAVEAMSRATRHARECQSPMILSRTLAIYALILEVRGDLDDAEAMLAESEATLVDESSDHLNRVMVDAFRVRIHWHRGDYERALDEAARVVHTSRLSGYPLPLGWGLQATIGIRRDRGDIEALPPLVDEMASLPGIPWGYAWCD